MRSTSSSPTNIPTNDEIVVINAGGKVFQALRSTLCLPKEATAFTKLFMKSNNVFLDHDPELVEIILNFLQMKKIEDPFDPIVEPPSVPENKTRDFRRLLNYYGLTAFFYYPTIAAKPTTFALASGIQSLSIQSLNTAIQPIPQIRRLSFDSHELEKPLKKTLHDSINSLSPEDTSIMEEFDYCYG